MSIGHDLLSLAKVIFSSKLKEMSHEYRCRFFLKGENVIGLL